METEFDINQEVEVLSYEESTQELKDKDFEFRNDLTISKAVAWLEKEDFPEVLWKHVADVGVGRIIKPQENLAVGLYFKHPNWREGKLCRVCNDIDIKVFLHFVSLMVDQEKNLKQLERFNQ